MSLPAPRPSCNPSDPWAPLPMPALRSGPPYFMAESIEREPDLAVRIGTDPDLVEAAGRIADSLRHNGAPDWSPAVVGCGTSEHAAMASAAIWRAAWRRAGLTGVGPLARQAFEAALDPWPGALVAISHEGGTRATVAAMQSARLIGTRVALVTAGANSPAAAAADQCLCVPELDRSWCHTVAYLGPIVAANLVADHLLAATTEPAALRAPLEAGLRTGEAAHQLAEELAATRTLVITGSGADRIAGRELALKIEEAAYVPTAFRDLETMLHGHVPSLDVGTGLVVLLTDLDDAGTRLGRARQLLRALARVGVRCGAIMSDAADAALALALTPAGRVVVPAPGDLWGPVGPLLASAIPLQLTTYHLALALGTNPDALRREFTPYRAAVEAAEAPDAPEQPTR